MKGEFAGLTARRIDYDRILLKDETFFHVHEPRSALSVSGSVTVQVVPLPGVLVIVTRPP